MAKDISRNLKTSIILCSFLVVLFSVQYTKLGVPGTIYGPYNFGHVTDPYNVEYINEFLTTQNYVSEQHKKSLFYISLINIIQSITAVHYDWYQIPGLFIILLLVFAWISPFKLKLRSLITFAAIAGPVGIIGYTYVFNRAAIDIILFFTCFLLLSIAYRSSSNSIPPTIILFTFSLIIWINHYSFWPFFFFCTVVLVILKYRSETKMRILSQFAVLFSPFLLYAFPSNIFTRSLVVLSTIDLSFESIFSAKSNTIPDQATIVTGISNVEPDWIILVTYGSYILPLTLASLVWFYTLFATHHPINRDFLDKFLYSSEFRPIFIATSLGFILTSTLYIAIGFSYRILIFWPIIIPLFFRDIKQSTDRLYNNINKKDRLLNKNHISTIITFLVILIVLIHLFPIFIPNYNIIDRSPNAPSEQQLSSSRFAEYANSEKPIYTDLLHASVIIIDTEKRYLRVGEAVTLSNGSIALDQTAAVLYDPFSKEGNK